MLMHIFFQQTLMLIWLTTLLFHYVSLSVLSFNVSWKIKLFVYWEEEKKEIL